MRAKPRLTVVGRETDRPEFAFEQFAQHFQPPLFRVLGKYCRGSEQEVEDLVHDVLLRALLRWGELRHWQEASQRAWLVRVAKNCYLDRYRRRRSEEDRLQALFRLQEDSDDGGEEDELWRYIEVADLQAVLPYLPPKVRTTFELYLQGLSYARISELTGEPPGTVGARLTQARRLLRELLKETAEARRREGPRR
ncbi:sigma-70 family RNA polymerase sigma factor [Myxococcus sp. K15C18031901]|uniref:RNA polymerase sigma factor n=1 Tax=Myxococcus dinghuensis TaxID=2906761 RepID=UPI0020A728DF|nr:sigma-70 family RNA polymerase sigma factor [Myxococcus dinghuensis]MCP3100106.1 sigma-70 family RNA polymerase sigma factor [Myxococcus dinghuensis]